MSVSEHIRKHFMSTNEPNCSSVSMAALVQNNLEDITIRAAVQNGIALENRRMDYYSTLVSHEFGRQGIVSVPFKFECGKPSEFLWESYRSLRQSSAGIRFLGGLMLRRILNPEFSDHIIAITAIHANRKASIVDTARVEKHLKPREKLQLTRKPFQYKVPLSTVDRWAEKNHNPQDMLVIFAGIGVDDFVKKSNGRRYTEYVIDRLSALTQNQMSQIANALQELET